MAFEVFTRETAAVSGKAFVSIQKKGIIALNRAAYVLIGEPAAVELLYDHERHLVGLRAVEGKPEHAQDVRPTAKGAYLVSAARFTNHYGIPTEEGHRWPAQMEQDILCVDISKPPVA